jgi:hypothetical protein
MKGTGMQLPGTGRQGRLITIMLGASLVAAACSGTAAAPSAAETPGTSNSSPTGATTIPTASPVGASSLPTDAPAGASTPPIDPSADVCAPFAGGAQPPATADVKALVGGMPKTVDGEPVRDPKAYPAMQVLCSGPDDGNALVQAFAQQFGLDLRTVVIGRFGVTVDKYATLVEVIRAPGQNGDVILAAFAVLGVAFDPASATPANVGGKDVMYMQDGDRKHYLYVEGDTIWTFTLQTDAQAAKLLAKLAGSS